MEAEVPSKILSQRRAFVFLVIEATALQFGHDITGKFLISARHVGRGEDIAVARAFDKPFEHLS